MKKVAFTCSCCGTLNIPATGDNWAGFISCCLCGSKERVSTAGTEKTARGLYLELSKRYGLPVTTLIELQKRGLLPRDLARRTQEHQLVIGAVALAIASEEILRGALARLPKERRKTLVHPVASDGLLTRWQRHVLDRYIHEYQEEFRTGTPHSIGGGIRYGSKITSIPAMILYLEEQYKLPAATSHRWVRKLKKAAYNRVRRANEKKEKANG